MDYFIFLQIKGENWKHNLKPKNVTHKVTVHLGPTAARGGSQFLNVGLEFGSNSGNFFCSEQRVV